MSGRPSTSWRRVSGHYPAFGTTTSRLTPRRASVCLSLWGYSVAYPSPSIRRPGRSSGPSREAGVGCENHRDPARSPWITSSTMSPRPAEITFPGPHHWVVPVPSRVELGGRRDEVLGFPVRGQVTTERRPLHRFAHARTCGFAFAPSAPRVTSTHWASATELQRPKLRKDSHLLAGAAARRTATTPARGAGRALVKSRQIRRRAAGVRSRCRCGSSASAKRRAGRR